MPTLSRKLLQLSYSTLSKYHRHLWLFFGMASFIHHSSRRTTWILLWGCEQTWWDYNSKCCTLPGGETDMWHSLGQAETLPLHLALVLLLALSLRSLILEWCKHGKRLELIHVLKNSSIISAPRSLLLLCSIPCKCRFLCLVILWRTPIPSSELFCKLGTAGFYCLQPKTPTDRNCDHFFFWTLKILYLYIS